MKIALIVFATIVISILGTVKFINWVSSEVMKGRFK